MTDPGPDPGPDPGTDPGPDPGTDTDTLAHIRELERRLAESEETLGAIRRGDIDALVVGGSAAEHRVYTLESADRPYRVLIEQIQEGAVTLGPGGTVFYCNRRLAEMLGVAQERLIGQPLDGYLRAADRDTFAAMLGRARSGVARGELTLHTLDGRTLPAHLALSLLESDGEEPLLCGVLTDLTQQKRHLGELSDANDRLLAEIQQRETVEEALRQSQKMEAVGQLTGGIAHDFNNLLTGISGSLQLMRTRIGQNRIGELERYIGGALASADRAAALTHRLLAFSRRQTLDPRLVDANGLVAGMDDLLRRTVGSTVAVETRLDPKVGTVLCDPNQLENALLNLAINARDAMPEGGLLTVATGDLELAHSFAEARGMAPGRYVAITVSDSGTGMSPEVAARAFDPFFTTKPLGMGTGLGLSMIYGFVKQSGGQVRIHSSPGLGTAVQLYLPRLDAVAAPAPQPAPPAHPQPVQPEHAKSRAGQGETVLVVDDEAVVRMLVVEVLRDLGYATLEAGDGAAALHLLETTGRIDLLVTDVGLPGGLNGRQVADAARVHRPGLKILFITGFAETAAVGNGTMEPGMEIMTKPFAMEALATRIRTLISA